MNGTRDRLRIFIDTRILLSAVLSDASMSAKLLRFANEEHKLLISAHSLTEATKVIKRKFPNRLAAWDKFLTALAFELLYTPLAVNGPNTRDPMNGPILASLFIAQPDLVVTSDQDFHMSEIREFLTVLSPADFVRMYGKEII